MRGDNARSRPFGPAGSCSRVGATSAAGAPRLPGADRSIRRTNVAAETYQGSFYCVKCKEKVDAEGKVSVNEKGTRTAKAQCPTCGTNLTRFLPKK